MGVAEKSDWPLDGWEQLLERVGTLDQPVEGSLGVNDDGDKVLVVVGRQVVQPLVDALEVPANVKKRISFTAGQ